MVESYIRHLYELAEHCNFRCKDEEIHERLVIGIANKVSLRKCKCTVI